MSESCETFYDALEYTARELPPTLLTIIIENLRTHETDVPIQIIFQDLVNVLPLQSHRKVVERLFSEWRRHKAGLSGEAMAELLQTATYCIRLQKDSLEMVWTGPQAQTSVRRTDQALLQLIRSAQQELIIVTFAAYKVPDIISAIKQALNRGVRIRFIAETVDESEGKVTFNALLAFGDAVADQVEVYVWPLENRERGINNKHGTLHAKCAVADRKVAFISSANLTEYALNINMEVGVLIRDQSFPQTLAMQFDRLILQRVLVKVD